MVRLSEKSISYSAGFFMLIAFGVGFNILGGLVGVAAVAGMTGQSFSFILKNVQEMIGNPVFLREMQVLQFCSATIGFFVPTLLVAWRLSHNPIELTGLKGKITLQQIALTILIIGCGLALSGALGYFTYKLPFPVDWRIYFDRLENDYAENAAGLVNLTSVPELILSIIILAIIPAICEETFFRGGLQNYMYRSTGKFWLSVIVVSIIFSAVHFSIYGFLSRVALGMVLGLLYQYSGRLWLSILAHFINNAAAVMVMYLQVGNGKQMQEILNDKSGSYLGFLALPIIVLLIIKYKKNNQNFTTLANGV